MNAMKIQKGNAHNKYDYWTVQVEPGEVVVDSGKAVPYGTWIGVIAPNRTSTVWSPAAYKPRGWKAAFERGLEHARSCMNVADWPESLECSFPR